VKLRPPEGREAVGDVRHGRGGTALRQQGRDIVDLSVGEPDFDTAEHVKAAARDAMARGLTIHPDRRDRRVEGRDRREAPARQRAHVRPHRGHGELWWKALALHRLPGALFDDGDEVLLPAPYWVSYPEMLVLSGAVPRVVETRADDGFLLSAAALEAAIGPRTVGLIVNSPSNPTGAAYSAEQLTALGRVAVRRGLVVVSDDIYERLTPQPVPEIGALVPELRPNLVIVNSVSKTYAMTGWRIGYTAAPVEVIRAMTVLQGQTTTNPTSIAQAQAAAALTGPQEGVDAMAREFARRLDVMVAGLRKIRGLRLSVPQGRSTSSRT
jgi:aspartate aminotransferase